jgi:hypothetical protein
VNHTGLKASTKLIGPDPSLPKKYKNIIITHVLEHLDDRVAVMKKVRNE